MRKTGECHNSAQNKCAKIPEQKTSLLSGQLLGGGGEGGCERMMFWPRHCHSLRSLPLKYLDFLAEFWCSARGKMSPLWNFSSKWGGKFFGEITVRFSVKSRYGAFWVISVRWTSKMGSRFFGEISVEERRGILRVFRSVERRKFRRGFWGNFDAV